MNTIPRNKFNQEVKDMYIEKYDINNERNWRQHKWKLILCSWVGQINIVNILTTPSNSKIHWNFYQNSNGIYHRSRTNNPKICK